LALREPPTLKDASSQTTANIVIEPSAGRHLLQQHLNSAARAPVYECDQSFVASPQAASQLTSSHLRVRRVRSIVVQSVALEHLKSIPSIYTPPWTSVSTS
jgi:hypothetical protein